MGRLITILGILVVVGAVAVPVMAWHPGWGHHMMGYWGSGPEYGGEYENLTSEQRSKLNALERKFYDGTSDLRDQIWSKSRELDSVMESPNADLNKAKSLQKEISDLRAKIDEKTLSYELEARKIIPKDQLGDAYGGWYGHHMGPYGHMMGYGPGYCWN
jgi:zinc resistance-associated protein